MRVLFTHDGMVGLVFPALVPMWFNHIEEALPIMHSDLVRKLGQKEAPTRHELHSDLILAQNSAKEGNTIAEFGVLGTYMYSTKENETWTN